MENYLLVPEAIFRAVASSLRQQPQNLNPELIRENYSNWLQNLKTKLWTPTRMNSRLKIRLEGQHKQTVRRETGWWAGTPWKGGCRLFQGKHS